jgi:AbrB family looped-hinge helix DNA binding protein
MRTKVSVKGQIVIPAELRAKYSIDPGDVVDVCDGDGKIIVFPLPKDVIKAGRGFLKGSSSLTAALLRARAEEDAIEDRRPSAQQHTAKKPR